MALFRRQRDAAPPPTEFQATKTFSAEQYADALQSWNWLPVGGKSPLFTSTFGDVFLQDGDGIWWLDLVGGALTREWDDLDALQAALQDAAGQDAFLRTGLASGAHHSGKQLGADQIYDFTVAPALGGSVEQANIGTIDFVVGVDFAGQLHEQIHDLPPGTPISGIELS